MFDDKSKKRPHRRKHERKEMSLLRVYAQVKIDKSGEILESRVLLNDLTPDGVGLFIDKGLEKGTAVSLVIEQPKNLFVRGKIVWSQPYTLNQKIITQDTFQFRVGIQFVFSSDEERKTLEEYCNELAKMNA